MEAAFLARFYGWTDDYITSLPFSRFSMYFKAGAMLDARENLRAIELECFTNYKQEQRDKILRRYKSAATMFEDKKVKDYREVLSNLARGLNGR